ncbi:MAG: cobalamin-binding protein [Candidatus Omnitrophica bacterium]|nr:cobalamin-binding protein [Candidatus Omnitrophota bacterium]
MIILNFMFYALNLNLAFSESGKKYISLAPSTTEILFDLGFGDNVVGVSTSCNYPSQAKKIEKIGTFSEPNIEKIASLKPDMIFATGLEQSQAVLRLKNLGFKVYVSDPRDIDGLLRSILDIGNLTGTIERAKILTDNMRQRIDTIGEKVSKIPLKNRLKVFLEIWHEPLMTAGPGSFIDDILSKAGGVNIASDVMRPYCRFSSEAVVKRNPDAIILAYMAEKDPGRALGSRIGWRDIKAIKEERVISSIDPDLYLRPGPRVAEAVEQVYHYLYEK